MGDSPILPVVTYPKMIAPHCRHRVSCHRTGFIREHGGQELLLVRRGHTFGTLVLATGQWDWSLVLVGVAWVEIERCGARRARFRVVEWPGLTDEAQQVATLVRKALTRWAGFTPCRQLRAGILGVLRTRDLRVFSDQVPGALTTDAAPLTRVGQEPTLSGRLALALDWVENELRLTRVRENSSKGRLSALQVLKIRDLTLWRRFLPGATRAAILYDSEPQPSVTQDLLLVCTERPSAIWALRKADGATVWKRSLRGVIGVPQLADGVVIVKLQKKVVALEIRSGRILWTFTPEKKACGIGLPVLRKDDCSVASGGRIYGLSLKSGETLWDIPFEGEVVASVAGLLLATGQSGFTALRHSTGERVWNIEAPWHHACSLTTKGLAVFRSAWGLSWVRPDTGEMVAVWRLTEEQRIHSFCVAGELAMVVLELEGSPSLTQLLALDRGRVIYSVPGYHRAAISFDSLTGFLYEWTYSGLTILNPENGRRLADLVGGHHLYCAPAVRDGLIHCFTLDAQIWAMRHPDIYLDEARLRRERSHGCRVANPLVS